MNLNNLSFSNLMALRSFCDEQKLMFQKEAENANEKEREELYQIYEKYFLMSEHVLEELHNRFDEIWLEAN